MLGKLMAYELRALWKPAAVMLAVMVVAGAAGIGCLGATQMLGEVARSGSGAVAAPMSGNATVALFMAALFCGFLVWAAVAALYVFVAMRFYRTMFTDEGYLTLTLPVPAATLVLAKFLVAFLLVVAASYLSTVLFSAMMTTVSSGELSLSWMIGAAGGMAGVADMGSAGSVLAGIVNIVVTAAFNLGLAFAALSLGAWWASRHKVAAAVGLYLGASWLLSLVFSVFGVILLFDSYSSVAMTVFGIVQMAFSAAVAVGAVALAIYVVKNKVDLS